MYTHSYKEYLFKYSWWKQHLMCLKWCDMHLTDGLVIIENCKTSPMVQNTIQNGGGSLDIQVYFPLLPFRSIWHP